MVGSNQVKMSMENLWTVHFSALILAANTSSKDLICEPFETSWKKKKCKTVSLYVVGTLI